MPNKSVSLSGIAYCAIPTEPSIGLIPIINVSALRNKLLPTKVPIENLPKSICRARVHVKHCRIFECLKRILIKILRVGRALLVSLCLILLLAFWGLRLGLYLLRREMQPSYQKEKKNNDERSSGIDGWGKVGIWATVSALYVSMFSPSLFTLVQPRSEMSWLTMLTQVFGLALMAASLLLEAVADKQKSDFKAQHPTQFCNVGLYRWVRCPNYLGEILIWVGNFIVGVTFYASIWQWAVSFIGLACITLIMMGSTKRLEQAQTKRYGGQKRYQEYIRTVPVLFPFVPVYSLKNVRVYLE